MPFQAGEFLTGPFAVISSTQKKTKKGDTYLLVELAHPRGTIEAKVWQNALDQVELEVGKVSQIQGTTELYMGKITGTVTQATLTDLSVEKYLPTAQTPTIVFDIETIGKPFASLDQIEQEYLLNNLEKNEPNKEVAKKKTGLHPLFGEVCAIAILNPDSQKGSVLFSRPTDITPEDQKYTFTGCPDEKTLLTTFWSIAEKYERFVSFNGNDFDFPFLMFRSAIQRVKIPFEVQVNSNGYIDLAKKIKAPNNRTYKLEMIMKAMGLSNPKEKGVHGGDVGELFAAGEYQKIVDYVARDVTSTTELYQHWKTYLAGKIVL